MVNFNWIKENRACRKGQSLVEVAVFGSFLLLVLGFLLNEGLRYNYQQEVKMESFRRALQAAGGSNIPKSYAVQVIKDVHFPDPSNMFALGDRSPVQHGSGVFWSNNSSEADYKTPETTPSTQYVFNPDSQLSHVEGVYRNWTNVALENQPAGVMVGMNSILNGEPDPYVVRSMSQTRVYQAEPDFGPKEVMVLENTSPVTGAGIDCEEVYCPKTILGQVEYNSPRSGLQYYPVFNVTSGNVGYPPDAIDFLNKDAGQINETLGAQQVVNKYIHKDSTVTLNENPSMHSSVESLNNNEQIKHVIMTSEGEQGPTFNFLDPEPTKTWITPK